MIRHYTPSTAHRSFSHLASRHRAPEFDYEDGDFDDGEEFHYEGDDAAGGIWGEGAAEAAEQAAAQRQPGAARLSGAKRPREAGELGA